jgi:hypothetical protein
VVGKTTATTAPFLQNRRGVVITSLDQILQEWVSFSDLQNVLLYQDG